MIGEIGLSKKGMDIDGIIEEYKVASDGNINAGDFVKFINNYEIPEGTENALYSQNGYGFGTSAVILSPEKVFIAYSNGSDTYYRLYGMVCTISNDIITSGTHTTLSTQQYSGHVLSVVKLSEDKVFIAHSSGSNYNTYGIVCTINGTTITKRYRYIFKS